ncbi:MAG: DUF2975 domain-containing protein [Clostridia bacterium]|nr:DUF2975 domain-containing protein [Clostridia bacterium]
MKQKELSGWLKSIVILGALCAVFLGVVIAPKYGYDFAEVSPELAYMLWPCLIFVWVSIVPVAAALVLVWQIAAEIGRDNSFCHKNAERLRMICIMALSDTLLYIAGGIYLALANILHISIFLLIVGIVSIGAALTVTAAALSHLTRKAADLKSENDLTI